MVTDRKIPDFYATTTVRLLNLPYKVKITAYQNSNYALAALVGADP